MGRNSEINLMDSRVGENITFAKAIRDELGSEVATCDLQFWRTIAEIFCECLLPDLALEKTLKESKLPAKPRATKKVQIINVQQKKEVELKSPVRAVKVDVEESRLAKHQDKKLS